MFTLRVYVRSHLKDSKRLVRSAYPQTITPQPVEVPLSFMVGYKNPQHFTAAFKKYFGYLPSELKR